MGCACGNKNQAMEFVYVDPKGKSTTYTSEVQARAAQIRNQGGSYTSRPK